jgi:hypothetical protein
MGVVCGAVWEQCGRLVGTGVLKDSTKAAVGVWCGGVGGCVRIAPRRLLVCGVGGCGLCSLLMTSSYLFPGRVQQQWAWLTAPACYSFCCDAHSSVGAVWKQCRNIVSGWCGGLWAVLTLAAFVQPALGDCY